MKLKDIREASMSDLTAGLAGRKPKVGEIWMHKDDKKLRVKVLKLSGRSVIYALEKNADKPKIRVEQQMHVGSFRHTYKPEK